MSLALDALRRCRRILGDATKVELSPAAWDTGGDEPFLTNGDGPIWEGLPGTHPLLPFINDAIRSLDGESS